jgi:Spy/CpxP family protein refolding chaperone
MIGFRNTMLLGTSAWALAFGAFAQTPSAPPAHFGPHFAHPLAALMQVKDQLNLNTSQQQQWDAALAQSKSAHASARSNGEQVKNAMQTELAKADPDFAAVAAVADSVEQQNSVVRKQARTAWLALYGTFTPEQKAIAKDAIKARSARFDTMRERMKARHGGG